MGEVEFEGGRWKVEDKGLRMEVESREETVVHKASTHVRSTSNLFDKRREGADD